MAELQLDQASVLGSMILAPEIIGDVVTTLTPEDFGAGDPADLFRALRALYMEGGKIDVVTALDRMGRTPEHQSYLLSVMDATPTAANWREYVRIVREQARLRALQSAGLELASTGTTLEKARDPVAHLDRLMRDRREVECVDMEAGMLQFTDEQARQPHYLPWGLPWLDEGLMAEAGDYIVLGGYPSDGKTSLALTLAVRMAKTQRVGFYSYETDADKLFDRIVAMTAQVGLPKLKLNAMNGNDWDAVAAVSARLGAVKLELVEASGMTVQDIRAHSLSKRYDVIFIDYLQKIKSDITGRGAADQFQVVSKISSDLQQFGRQTGTPVIALSQLSRPEKTKAGKIPPPTLSALRSSGQIEQDADVVMLLYREEPDNSNSRRILNVAKNKEGEANIALMLTFDGQTQTFRKSAVQVPLPPQDKRWQPCNDDIPEQFKLPG